MRKSILVIGVMVLFISLLPFLISDSVSSALFEEELDLPEAKNQAVSSNELQIHVLGDKESPILKKIKSRKINSLNDLKDSKQSNSIWITKEHHDILFDTQNIKKLDKMLDKGYTVAIFDFNNIALLEELFLGAKPNFMFNPDSDRVIAFISKDNDGDYSFGHLIFDDEISQELIIEELVGVSWNKRNDYKLSKKSSKETLGLIRTNVVEASRGSEIILSYGSSWRNINLINGYSPTFWSTVVVGRTLYDPAGQSQYIIHGRLYEQRSMYKLDNPGENSDFYAFEFRHRMVPANEPQSNLWWASPNFSSKRLAVRATSHTRNGVYYEINNSAPIASPTTGTMTIDLNVGVADGKFTGFIKGSYSFEKKDLKFIDVNSRDSQGRIYWEPTFIYERPDDSYAKNQSRHTTTFILKTNKNTWPIYFMHSRRVEFSAGWPINSTAISTPAYTFTLTY